MTDAAEMSEDYTVKCSECPWESLPEKTHAEAVESARRHWDYNHGSARHQRHISTFEAALRTTKEGGKDA